MPKPEFVETIHRYLFEISVTLTLTGSNVIIVKCILTVFNGVGKALGKIRMFSLM